MTGCECVVPKAPGENGRHKPERAHRDAPLPGQCRVSMPEDPETFVTDWALCDVTPPAGAAPARALTRIAPCRGLQLEPDRDCVPPVLSRSAIP